MYLAILITFFTVSITFIVLVMFQQSKGAGIENSFNSNTSGVLFNTISSDCILNRTIVILAILFFLINLILSNWNNNNISNRTAWENLSVPTKTQKVNFSSKKLNKHN
ncbi:preprotein translocase subunit SecG [Candidatus Pantoea edessiphila]|uniref:Protein-export membrane protein SecG n=1 Tax=Candidatus Pantoea edessiphila TaxID=2044610 RepID=A0A2P5SW52_9GAMM|nr:preprotein translocase subunit SecG [Candidatus Pantoea edessiphila]PPI86554.1 preprotein translocase subunit SecG [Candidatus Pantoea edessiphila]